MGAGLSRFGDSGVMVLTSLLGGEKHGYAIIEDIAEQVGVRLGPGTLYGSLATLEDKGLIEPVSSEGRRRPYRLTPAGRQALGDHVATWERVVATARLRWQTS